MTESHPDGLMMRLPLGKSMAHGVATRLQTTNAAECVQITEEVRYVCINYDANFT